MEKQAQKVCSAAMGHRAESSGAKLFPPTPAFISNDFQTTKIIPTHKKKSNCILVFSFFKREELTGLVLAI